MTGQSIASAIVAVGLMCGLSANVHAQADSIPDAQVKDTKRPLLGPHRFIPNPLTGDPFSRTFVRNSLGIGQATDLQIIPSFVIGTDTIAGVTGDLIFALLDFEYQQRIKDWMGFWVRIKINGRLGDDVGALVAEGVTMSTGFDIGWKFKFLETDRIALAASAKVAKRDFTGMNLFSFIQGKIDSQPIPLVRNVPTLWTGGGLHFAWAANTWLGVTATGNLLYGESPDRSKGSGTAQTLSAAADVDFASLINVPIGVVLAMDWGSDDPNGESSNSSQAMLVRIAYTGRDDFVMSLDLSGLHTTLFSGTTVDVGSVVISMQYYF